MYLLFVVSLIFTYYHFSHSCCYYQMWVLESEPLAERSPIFAQCEPLRMLNSLFSLAVIKFVSEVLDLSLIQWFPARRFLLLASILWFDRTSVWYWKKALLQSTTEIWFATSQSACWYDVLTDWMEACTTVAFFFPERWPRGFALLLLSLQWRTVFFSWYNVVQYWQFWSRLIW